MSADDLAQRLAEVKERARAQDRAAARADRTTTTATTTGSSRSSGITGGSGSGGAGGVHHVYVFLSDQTLATGQGVVRVEGYEPMLATQMRELLGHDKVIVKPVIDLRHNVSVDQYEIPQRIRERVRLMYPVSPFPWSNAETTLRTDLDHIQPYDNNGPPGQTSLANLGPLPRTPHRAKTFGGWRYQRLPDGAIQWVTRNGTVYRVDHNGTHRISTPQTNQAPAPDPAPGADTRRRHRHQ
ncbi:hypothetical protein [Kribbella deserti]|uniref:HNH endonuclease n=1 Tax=Kribbella deserti TaxID=1926257 RepID=A0ABV6QMF9_9ACTN